MAQGPPPRSKPKTPKPKPKPNSSTTRKGSKIIKPKKEKLRRQQNVTKVSGKKPFHFQIFETDYFSFYFIFSGGFLHGAARARDFTRRRREGGWGERERDDKRIQPLQPRARLPRSACGTTHSPLSQSRESLTQSTLPHSLCHLPPQ